MSWADEEAVVAITGQAATPASIALAQTMIELIAGTNTTASDAELISGRNLGYLQKAVAFQAVWLDAHPDVLEVMDVQGVSQDGLNAQYANANAHLYAPLARMCVNRLSWRSGPIKVRAKTAYGSERGNRDSAVRDDQYEWSPL